MDRRKAARRRSASVDDIALVKAAAWAWYQHGSGSERPMMREFDVERIEKVQKPSRYKLEAIREVEEGTKKVTKNIHHQHSSSTIPILPSSNISDLLDKYEIQRISRQLDRYIEASGRRVLTGTRNDVVMKSNKKGSNSHHPKGFWLRHVAVCRSSRNDVVETGGGARWPPPPRRYIPAVKTVGCGPRASCI